MLLERHAVLANRPGQGARTPETELRPRRHHQHHGSGTPRQHERYETPDPVRPDAVEARFHFVRQASGSGPIFMINISRMDIVLERHERGIHAV